MPRRWVFCYFSLQFSQLLPKGGNFTDWLRSHAFTELGFEIFSIWFQILCSINFAIFFQLLNNKIFILFFRLKKSWKKAKSIKEIKPSSLLLEHLDRMNPFVSRMLAVITLLSYASLLIRKSPASQKTLSKNTLLETENCYVNIN